MLFIEIVLLILTNIKNSFNNGKKSNIGGYKLNKLVITYLSNDVNLRQIACPASNRFWFTDFTKQLLISS